MADATEQTAQTVQPEKKNVYITIYKKFVKTDIPYSDRATGELKTFNSVTLPSGTKIDGMDYGGWQFSPWFVNPSKFRGENYVDIPLLKDRLVKMHHSVVDEEGNYVKDENGKVVQERAEIRPEQIKEALAANYRRYRAGQSQEQAKESPEKGEGESLAKRAASAREASQTLSGDEARQPAMAR
ncbi:DNA gyrase [Adlercreutzia sp. ZJ141]|uniref:DNA gyrase n=1 Tax=Adlercreutzia sp. ZJ141 TaxID=2709406 RepID=UPI0013EC3834|nr:DNA gyrase [Adlercreutzia sp. ZJ141]